MKKIILNIDQAEAFIKANAAVHDCLTRMIKYSISEKKTAFSKEKFEKEYDFLRDLNFVSRESDNSFLLDYNHLPVSYVLTEIAEETMGEKVPEEPIACLNFANRFAEAIRQPAPRTFWYSDLEIQFEAYLLIYLHQLHGIDITDFMQGITEEMLDQIPDVRSVDMTYRHVFAYLSDNVEKSFATIILMLSSDRTKDSALDALRDVGKTNPDKAIAFYKYSKDNKASDSNGFLPNLLIGLFHNDENYYLNEAIKLFSENPNQSLLALTWLEYTHTDQIATAFEFLAKQTETEIEFLRNVPTFYIRLMENKLTPEPIIQPCFKMIEVFIKNEDEQLRGNLVWRISMINGYDEEKYNLLPGFMAWGKPYFIRDYFNYFNSPHYLFDLVKESFLHHGMGVDMELLKSALSSQYHRNKEKFQEELLSLLSDNIAIIRYAGIQVMLSRYGTPYETDFLKLDEIRQVRVIETLLPLPMNIEELMPLVLSLRNSPFDAVKKKLETELIDLIGAYDYNLIELVQKYLDTGVDDDKQLLESLGAAYIIYQQEKESKDKINELNPVENELEYVDLFFRLEHEKQTEMIEEAQSKSFFSVIGKSMHVIRGKGFNSEANTDISIMGEIGVSRLVDQRYSINPDKYEWNFKMNAIAKNYKIPSNK